MESQRNSSLTRSISSVSLESMQQRGTLQARNHTLESELYASHQRMRSNSWQEQISLSSHNSGETNSINGSVEQLPNCYNTPSYLEHARSRSEEGEQLQQDANVGRSVSDCTGSRHSFRVPFVRMGDGRRSVRTKTRLAELKYQGVQSNHSPMSTRRFSNILPAQPTMTSIDLELELEAAYTKQVYSVNIALRMSSNTTFILPIELHELSRN